MPESLYIPSSSSLSSLGSGLHVAVIGASGGIGAAICEHLVELPEVSQVSAFSRSLPAGGDGRIVHRALNLEDEGSIADAAADASAFGPLSLVFVASGLLHDGDEIQPEKTWRAMTSQQMARNFAVNATGPALVAKHFLPLLTTEGKAVFAAISARVGSISDNHLGGWYAYRASKAALNMLIKTLSIELVRRQPNVIIAGLHPGTVDTSLSKPFQGNVPEGKLFRPEYAAGRLLNVIDGLDQKDTGSLFAWDGERIPF